MTKIKKDDYGLYVVAGGWIARPLLVFKNHLPTTTKYKEGDKVKAHHFCSYIGVGGEHTDFRKRSGYEMWVTSVTHHLYRAMKMFYPEKFDEWMKDIIKLNHRYDEVVWNKWVKMQKDAEERYFKRGERE